MGRASGVKSLLIWLSLSLPVSLSLSLSHNTNTYTHRTTFESGIPSLLSPSLGAREMDGSVDKVLASEDLSFNL